MEVILLDKVVKLGSLGDKVKVKNGYARNYLIPAGKAKPATAENLEEFKLRRAELEKEAAESLNAALARKEAIEKLNSITIKAKTGGEGKLFGSVGTYDIVEAANTASIKLEKSEVRLPEGNFRAIGEYEVALHLHSDVDATLQVIIEPEE